MPGEWKSDEDYNQDQRAMALIQKYYSTDVYDFGRDWGEDENGVSPPVPELHLKIEKLYAEKIKEYPSGHKPVLILMAGAGGIGKTTTLNSYLKKPNDPESPEAEKLRGLTEAPKGEIRENFFIRLSHQSIKEEICRMGGVDHIPKDWWKPLGDIPDHHRYRTEDRYDLKSAAVHRESSWLMDRAAEACMEAGISIAYDISVTNKESVEDLLVNADKHGYSRVAISVEGSEEQALQGNYENWQKGLIVSPEEVIKESYTRGRDGQSVCRKNIQELAKENDVPTALPGSDDYAVSKYRYVDAVIEVNRSSPDMRLKPGQGLKNALTQTTPPLNPVAPFANESLPHPDARPVPPEPGALSSDKATPLARPASSESKSSSHTR